MSLPGRLIPLVVGLAFAAAGSALLIGASLRPAWQLADAQGWTERTCTITDREVERTIDSDGDHRYRTRIAYDYEVAGVIHRGHRHSFGKASSSRQVAEDATARLGVGARVPCWVDPDDPRQAVLARTGFSWWAGLVGLLFQLVGMLVMTQAWSDAARRPRARVTGGVLVVRPAWRPVLVVAIVALLVAAQLVVTAIGLVRATLVLQAVGYLVAAAPAAALAAHRFGQWATGLRLEITPPVLAIGQRGQIRWTMRAPFGIARGRLRLVGREVVVVGSGSSTETRTEAFCDRKLADLTSRQAARPVTLAVPPGLPSSFVAGNARVDWLIAVHVELPRWPDLDLEVPVEVEPAATEVARPRPPRLDASTPPRGDRLDLDATEHRPGAAVTGVVGWRRDEPPSEARVELRRHVEINGTTELHTAVVAALDVATLARIAGPGADADPYRGVVQTGPASPPLEQVERRELYLAAPRGPITHAGDLLRVSWSLALVIDGADQVICGLEIHDAG